MLILVAIFRKVGGNLTTKTQRHKEDGVIVVLDPDRFQDR